MSLPDKEIKLTFLGDLMCLAPQIAAIRRSGSSYNDIFARVKHLWADSDYVMANLETPVTSSLRRLSKGQMSFNAPFEFLKAVKDAGIDFVSLANNHCLDRGIDGLDETIRCIQRVGLETSGAYLTEDESQRVHVKTINGVRFSIVCCTYGINGLDESGLPQAHVWKVDTLTHGSITHRSVRHMGLRAFIAKLVPERIKIVRRALMDIWRGGASIIPISDSIHPAQVGRIDDLPCVERVKAKLVKARKLGDYVIVLPHLGGQYNPAPGIYQKKTMSWQFESGADIIVSNHAHRCLRCERFDDGRLAAYALGNFCFTPGFGYYLPNVLADYSIVLSVYIKNLSVDRIVFHTVKSVVRQDGVSVVIPVCELYSEEKSILERERLLEENEAVVNCFSGRSGSIEIEKEYLF